MVKRAGATSALIFGLLGVAHAAGPSFDCARFKAGSVEALICGSVLLSALDAEMARLYRLARSADGGPSPADLKKHQLTWLKIRNECLKAPASPVCLRDRYLGRIASLRAESTLARSDDGRGISLGPAAFRCENTDGLLFATFVRTNPPLAYLTRKDTRLTLEIRPSGSGAKYGGEGDEFFWEHQGEARYRESSATREVHCKKEAID